MASVCSCHCHRSRRESPQRFVVFAGECYDALGGWHDMLGVTTSREDARRIARFYATQRAPADIWWHIVDIAHEDIILNNGEDAGTPSADRTLQHPRETP